MSTPKIIAVVPARMGASRFPGKPLAKILGLPMIEHVRRRLELCECIDKVYVATCDREIMETVQQNGGEAILTDAAHQRCTDRVEEAVRLLDAQIVLIVQGDEPLFSPELAEKLIEPLLHDDQLLCTNLLSVIKEQEDLRDIDIVKAVVNQRGNVMYYSRSPIPCFRERIDCPMYRQTGLAAFRKSFLKDFSHLPPTSLEISESIDFLRILEHGFSIRAVVHAKKLYGVDRLEDIRRIEQILLTEQDQRDWYNRIL